MVFFAVSFLHLHQSLQLVLHPAIKAPVLAEVPGNRTGTGSGQRTASTGAVGHALLCSPGRGYPKRALSWGHSMSWESPSPPDAHLAAEMKTLRCRYRVKLQLVPLVRSILPPLELLWQQSDLRVM